MHAETGCKTSMNMNDTLMYSLWPVGCSSGRHECVPETHFWTPQTAVPVHSGRAGGSGVSVREAPQMRRRLGALLDAQTHGPDSG